MRYLALATDYDGTLATNGQASADAIATIARLRGSGRRAILVTGRRLEDLSKVLPELNLFDYVVAENGAVVYAPGTKEVTLLGEPPRTEFIERLRSLGVNPIEVGQVVIATWLPNQGAVLQAIQDTGLELLIVFNKSAVMVLPTGINKATGLGLRAAKAGTVFSRSRGYR